MAKSRNLVIAILLLASALTGAPAHAVGPTLTLAPSLGAPTTTTTANGTGFAANSLVDVYFDNQQVGFVATDAAGALGYQLTVPASAQPGAHTVTAVAHNGSLAVQATYTVRTNWPQWRGDATGGGNNRFENVLNTSTVGDLDLDWAPGGTTSETSAPVTSGAYVYVVNNDGHLRAYNRTTHALKFDVNAGASLLIPPLASGAVVITTGSGQMQARNITTGALVWQASLPSAVGAPVVSAGVVYVAAEGSTTVTNGLYAFKTTCGTGGATCTPLWIGPGGLAGGSAYFPEMGVAVGAGRVYARLGNDLLAFAVDCGTGGATCSPVGSVSGLISSTSPAFANGYVYTVEGASVVVRRASCLGCTPLWSGTLPAAASRTVTVAGSRLYVVQGTTLFVFRSSCGAATCSPLWSTDTAGGTSYAPTVANGVVYVPTANDVFAYPVNCYSGCPPLWNAGSGGTYSNAPYATVTVSDGKVYSPSSSGLQVYSTSATPLTFSVRVSQLRPDQRFAAAEARAERRLAALR